MRKPGVWAPWPGATMTSTCPLCLVRTLHRGDATNEVRGRFLVGFQQKWLLVSERVEPTAGEREAQGLSISWVGGSQAGQPTHLAQAVADGVGVPAHSPEAGRDAG